MGQQQSKDELLYKQVSYGNIEGIKSLRTEGAGLEWIDSEGKTPLVVACMNPELYNVAKTLIELGANVNAYRPGRHAGTPLHHAAKRGLEHTVKLLLSHGANALLINDDCQTPLDVARAKGYSSVVRTIEGHVCLFSGWLRELYGPGILGRFAPQLLSRKVWVVILPCGSRSLRKPLKLELAIYATNQDAQTRTIFPLWKANLDEPNFNLPDPAAIISDLSKSTRIKLAPALESEKQQLQRFCNACKGIPQVMHPSFPFNNPILNAPATAPATSEDEEIAMAINASLQSAMIESQPHIASYTPSQPDASTSSINPMNTSNHQENHYDGASSSHDTTGSKCEVSTVTPALENPPPVSVTSAPHAGPIHYPSIDSTDTSPVDLPPPSGHSISGGTGEMYENGVVSSSCTICLDAPLEGACVPCGHMAGCMSCLIEIKAKKWGCPVCRSKIDQVIRIYAV
ncbi:putative E3 ubiquitin-protein ligase XBAT35 [Primulina huaijiensis]|uniref:putative E3 ubiquitin-protein ligase XBAT35 n=1 Tax=Primulina huaijiensis TaxID=1492673 RepID=UPI003CC7811B